MEFFDQLCEETEQEKMELMAAPIIERCLLKEISLDDYVGFLVQAFHHVKHTVPLMMSVGARLGDDKEWLREAVAEYIQEEIGHQEWILNDIGNCGYDKEWVRHSRPHPSTELMIAYAYDMAQRVSPIGFFGMVHVLEGTSINLADRVADSVREALDLPKNAFSYLYSHGLLDQDHVKFFKDLMNKITEEEDQRQIIHSCKMFYQLYGNIFRTLNPDHGVPLLQHSAVA